MLVQIDWLEAAKNILYVVWLFPEILGFSPWLFWGIAACLVVISATIRLRRSYH